MNIAGSARGLFDLTRPGNTIAAGALTFIGAFVAGGAFDQQAVTVAAVGATWFATAAGMAINDYFDREIDCINNPERPIPRGAVSARGALAFSGVLFAGAVVLSLLLPPLALGIAAVNLVGLVAYTNYFKGLPGAGNALVAYLGGSTFLFGAAAVGRPLAGGVLAALAILSTFTREIIKDVEDVEGDRAEGLNTLPIAVGERRALWFGSILLVVAVAASPLPYALGTFGVWYLVAVAPADALMLVAAHRSFERPAAGQRLLKLGMFVAAAAFVIGRVTANTQL